jgi:hypothetical protein
MKYVSWKDMKAFSRDMKSIYKSSRRISITGIRGTEKEMGNDLYIGSKCV